MTNLSQNNPCTSLSNHGYSCSTCGLNQIGGFNSLSDEQKTNYCFWSALPSANGQLSHCKTSPTTNICPLSSIYDTKTNQVTMPDCSRISAGSQNSIFENCYNWYNESKYDITKNVSIDNNIDNYCTFKRNQQFNQQSTNKVPNHDGPYNDCLCWAAVKGHDSNYNKLVQLIGPDIMNKDNITCSWPSCNSKNQLVPSNIIPLFPESCTPTCQQILNIINKKNIIIDDQYRNYLQKCSTSSSFSFYLSIFIILFVAIIIIVSLVVFYY